MPFLDSWRIADINITSSSSTFISSTSHLKHSHEEKMSPRNLPPIIRHSRALPPIKLTNKSSPAPSSLSLIVTDTTPLRRFSGNSYLSVNIDTGSLFIIS